jgi:5,10-methylenetetrahydromethanopterin reductase
VSPSSGDSGPAEAPGQYGVIFSGDRGPEWLGHMRRADQAGFWGLGVGDSQSIYPDVYVRLALAAGVVSRAHLGTWVTNPLTRHPAVTASAMASIDELTGGRTFLGIGTGDSAVKNIGQPPATLDFLEDYIRAVNQLQTTGTTIWQGSTCRLAVPARRVPVWLAVSGPRATRLAGRIADGVVFGGGLTEDIIEAGMEELRRGADEAGRDVAEIKTWWLAVANLADDDDVALNELKGSLATFGHMATKSAAQRRHLDPGIQPAMERLHTDYDAMQHAAYGASDNARLPDELGLTDYLRRRFAICGSPSTFSSSIDRAHAAGARNLWFAVRVPDKDRFLRLWENQVAPTLR